MTQLTATRTTTLPLARIAGVIFDLDSVVTTTATSHARAWSRMFDVAAYPATVQLIRDLRRYHVRTAIVTAGRNCEQILAAAGVANLFDALVHGAGADQPEVPGRPGPTAFLLAAERLGILTSRCAVVEDGVSGIAGLSGFGVVIGIDRTGDRDAYLSSHGADAVVRNLSEVRLTDPIQVQTCDERP